LVFVFITVIVSLAMLVLLGKLVGGATMTALTGPVISAEAILAHP
jgi:hypothetical protein